MFIIVRKSPIMKDKKSNISVIIPVYNRIWQLRRSLQSLVDQTYPHFDVVICDDGSNEDIASAIPEYADKLNLTYFKIENFGGPARPRNLAVNKAKSEWISFLDSDDWWDVNRIEVIISILDKGYHLIYHPLRVVRQNNGFLNKIYPRIVGKPMTCNPLRYMALYGNPIATSGAVVRRDALNMIGGMCEDMDLVAFEDFDAWLKLAEIGCTIHYCNAVLGNYWVGLDSISLVANRQIYKQEILFGRHMSHFQPFIKQALARQNYVLGMMWSRVSGCSKIAEDYLISAGGLADISMQLKRCIKLCQVFFENRVFHKFTLNKK